MLHRLLLKMTFAISDQRQMPVGLQPSKITDAPKPAEYYRAMRQQTQALSSLSALNKRPTDSFLKAYSGDTKRL